MYPQVQLKDNIDNILFVIQNDNYITQKQKTLLISFLDYFKKHDLNFLQENYVSIFDRQKKFSLYLFEHIHGDSRERGTAIIDLQNLYKSYNFDVSDGKELPDYIPLFLEFISLIEEKDACNMIGEIINLISIIGKRLELINNEYSIIFYVLESLSIVKPDNLIVEKIVNKDKNLDNEINIDKEWEEEKIF